MSDNYNCSRMELLLVAEAKVVCFIIIYIYSIRFSRSNPTNFWQILVRRASTWQSRGDSRRALQKPCPSNPHYRFHISHVRSPCGGAPLFHFNIVVRFVSLPILFVRPGLSSLFSPFFHSALPSLRYEWSRFLVSNGRVLSVDPLSSGMRGESKGGGVHARVCMYVWERITECETT